MKNEEQTLTPILKQGNIKLKDISLSKTNPRKHIDKKDQEELINSVREQGVIQPVLLRPLPGSPDKYELVCGERRYRAAEAVMGAIQTRDSIPAIIRELSDDQVLELQIIENLQRKDIHPMEEALGFKNLVDRKKWSQEEIAKRIGKSVSYVAQRIKINELIKEFQNAFFENRLNFTTALDLSAFNANDQRDIWKEEFKDGSGKILINNSIIKKYTGNLNDAPFDTKDLNLVKEMGACTGCRFNTAANTSLFPESESDAKCANRSCYIKKVDLSFAVNLAAAIKDPTIELIAESHYADDKLVKKLTDDGQKVLIEYKHYDEDYVDEKPELSEFEEELVTEDNEYGEYETRDEMMKAYNKAIEDWQKDVAKQEEKYKKGKLIKGFMVAGDNKGKYIYITLRSALAQNNGKPAKASAASFKEAEEKGKVSKDDIRTEIKRIEDNEKRKKEIDGEKVMPKYYALIDADPDEEEMKKCKFSHDGPFTNIEKAAFIVSMASKLNFFDEEYLYKILDSKKIFDNNDGDYDLINLYKSLKEKSHKDLDRYMAILTRIWLMGELHPGSNGDPESDGKDAALVDIVRTYYPKEAQEIHNEMMKERLERGQRTEKRLDELKLQLDPKYKPKADIVKNPKADPIKSKEASKPTPAAKKTAPKKAAKKPAAKKATKKVAKKK